MVRSLRRSGTRQAACGRVFSAMNAVYAAQFDRPFPARTTIGVASLPLGARIEIEMIVVVVRPFVTLVYVVVVAAVKVVGEALKDLAPAGFDARFSAIWRRYAYRVTAVKSGIEGAASATINASTSSSRATSPSGSTAVTATRSSCPRPPSPPSGPG